MNQLGKITAKQSIRALQIRNQQIHANIEQQGSTLIYLGLMMVNLQEMKNQARIKMQKGRNQTSKKYPTKKCMNRRRWVGFGPKGDSFMHIHEHTSRSGQNQH